MDLDVISCEKLSGIVLKGKQKEAISALLGEEDLFTVIPFLIW